MGRKDFCKRKTTPMLFKKRAFSFRHYLQEIQNKDIDWCSLCIEKREKDLLIPKVKKYVLDEIEYKDEKENTFNCIKRCKECSNQYTLWKEALNRPFNYYEEYQKIIKSLIYKAKYKIQRFSGAYKYKEACSEQMIYEHVEFEHFLYNYWIPLCLMRYWIKNGLNSDSFDHEKLEKEMGYLRNASLRNNLCDMMKEFKEHRYIKLESPRKDELRDMMEKLKEHPNGKLKFAKWKIPLLVNLNELKPTENGKNKENHFVEKAQSFSWDKGSEEGRILNLK